MSGQERGGKEGRTEGVEKAIRRQKTCRGGSGKLGELGDARVSRREQNAVPAAANDVQGERERGRTAPPRTAPVDVAVATWV